MRHRSRKGDRGDAAAENRHERPPGRNERDAIANTVAGVLPVLEVLRSHSRRIDKILIAEGAREHRLSDIVDLARNGGVPVHRVPRESLGAMLEPGTNHQGVVAVTAAANYAAVDDILANLSDPALLLVLDGVEDPRNLGALLRVAECAGIDGIVIPERRAVGLTDTVAKSSAGAVEYVKVGKSPNLNRFIAELKDRGIWVVGASADAATTHTEWDWKQPSALVLGGEGRGLHRLVAENCDTLIKIPMHGKIESLNVSVAAGVILFEARRQRGG